MGSIGYMIKLIFIDFIIEFSLMKPQFLVASCYVAITFLTSIAWGSPQTHHIALEPGQHVQETITSRKGAQRTLSIVKPGFPTEYKTIGKGDTVEIAAPGGKSVKISAPFQYENGNSETVTAKRYELSE